MAEIAWQSCRNLKEFPPINFLETKFSTQPWRSCSALKAFPFIDFFWENFIMAWSVCGALEDFPANMFDTTGPLASDAFIGAWEECALTKESIENILVSLDTNGQSNIELGIFDGRD